MKPYSMDFRRSAAAARESGMSTAEVSETFGCSPSWVRRLMQRQRESGSLQPRAREQPDQHKIDEQERWRLREFVARRPDATLGELIAALDLKVHPGTLSRTLAVMDLRLKKSPCTPASRTGRTSRNSVTAGFSSSPT
jgi:transposase